MSELMIAPKKVPVAVQSSFGSESEIREHFGALFKKELRGKKILFSVLGVAALAAILPLVGAAIMSGLGLMAIGALLVAAGVVWKWVPHIFRRVEHRIIEANQKEMNRHLAALKAEARKNPVEQLQNYLFQKQAQLRAYKEFVSQVGSQVKSAGDMLSARKKKRPAVDYSKKDAAMQQMQAAYQAHLQKSKEGEESLVELKEAIEDAKFDWEFGTIGQAAMQQMQALEGQDLVNEMLAGEAFDAVRTKFNRVFSDIEVQIGSINSSSQIEFGEGFAFDVSAFHIPSEKELVHVER